MATISGGTALDNPALVTEVRSAGCCGLTRDLLRKALRLMWMAFLWMALLVGSLWRPWLRGGPLLGLGLWPGLWSWALRGPLGWLRPLHLLHLRLRLD